MNSKKYLTKREISDNRSEILHLLDKINRDGINKVKQFLDDSGYFFAYGSEHHHTYAGGLAEHSLGVYHIAIDDNNEQCSEESIIIASLLHDLCKVRPKKIEMPKYGGHGIRSVKILEDFLGFKLTSEERNAIEFHMRSGYSGVKDKRYNQAISEGLQNLIHRSDCIDAGGYKNGAKTFVSTIFKILGL